MEKKEVSSLVINVSLKFKIRKKKYESPKLKDHELMPSYKHFIRDCGSFFRVFNLTSVVSQRHLQTIPAKLNCVSKSQRKCQAPTLGSMSVRVSFRD
jgi:hypothetical protein